MSPTTLTLEIRRRVAWVTFTRPERLNSLTEAMLDELAGALDEVERDPEVRALVLTGTGRAFSVGLDLALLERAFAEPAYFGAIIRRLNRVLLRLGSLDLPVVAAVNGLARAGGFELIVASDLVVVAETARLSDDHGRFAVMPAAGSTQLLPRRIGAQRALELLWTGRWFDGREAVALGLALRAVPAEALAAEVETLVGGLRDKPRAYLAAIKRVIREGAALPLERAMEMETDAFVRYLTTYPYAREGYAASLEGRAPSWAS
jgi:enoyl-CoA hydratase/carnithine racemase